MPNDEIIRESAGKVPVPHFEQVAFVRPRPLREATVAIVTTAGLHGDDQPGYVQGDQTFRVIDGGSHGLTMGHSSLNFDRSGFVSDPNVVFPIDRLRELAADGVIGRVAPRHISFMGALDETMSTIRLDSGPAAAKLLRDDGVDIVLLTPV